MARLFRASLEQRVSEIAKDDAIRAVVLTAAGTDNFSVGMNLKQLPEGMNKMGSADAVFDQGMAVFMEKRSPSFDKSYPSMASLNALPMGLLRDRLRGVPSLRA
jgi:enoyl-CoA hydratase/carnithine racemase